MSGVGEDDDEAVPQFEWDEEIASQLPGRVVLVGITTLDPDGQVMGVSQFYGTVVSADRRAGILLELGGARAGRSYNLPPMTDALHFAAPGVYRLRETGEEVENPDFTVTWSVQQPSKS